MRRIGSVLLEQLHSKVKKDLFIVDAATWQVYHYFSVYQSEWCVRYAKDGGLVPSNPVTPTNPFGCRIGTNSISSYP